MSDKQMPPIDESLLKKSQLADLLGLSTRSIDRKILEGEVPQGFLLGGAKRWRKSLVNGWIAAGCPKAHG